MSKMILRAWSASTSANFSSTSRELLPRMILPVICSTVMSGATCLRSMVRITVHLFNGLLAASLGRKSGKSGFYLNLPIGQTYSCQWKLWAGAAARVS
jgi:hypothetical protein